MSDDIELSKALKKVNWIFSKWNPSNWYWAKPSRYYKRLKIILAFIKLGYNWNAWDYSHIWPVLRYLIQDIHNDLVEDTNHYQDLYIEDTKLCLELLDRLIENRYNLDTPLDYEGDVGELEQKDIHELFAIIRLSIRNWWT